MPGHHVQTAVAGRARIWLAGLAVALGAVLIAAFAAPATASTHNVKAQLSLSGLASSDNPLGGSVIGVLPGDKVTFSAATAPTAGLQKLGLSDLVGSVLSLGGNIQVTANFSKLPGGRANTVLTSQSKTTFTFPRGSYSFTWTAQRVTVLGAVPVDLDGNELASAGVKLNASNQYVGQIVSSNNPPQGGLSVQLPNVKVAPSAPVVGQLPTLSIPGVTLPTVGTSVPDLNPGSAAAGKTGSTAGGAKTSAPAPGITYEPPAVSVPQMAVPGGAGSDSGGSGGGGFRLGLAGTGANGQLAAGSLSSGGSSSSNGGSTSGSAGNGTGSSKTVDLASSSASPSGQLPVLLAILAVITLAMVAGTYARLYLLGRKSSKS